MRAHSPAGLAVLISLVVGCGSSEPSGQSAVDSGSDLGMDSADSSIEDTSIDDAPKDAEIDTNASDSADAIVTDADGGTAAAGLFEQPHPWTDEVVSAPVSSESKSILSAVESAGGLGSGLRLDFSTHVLHAAATTPYRTFAKSADFYDPDCDFVPFPVPPGGAVENSTDYRCPGYGDGGGDLADCHLLVIDPLKRTLYEMYGAHIDGSTFLGGCAVAWDLTKKYPATLRGKGCVSADMSGMPITPLLATPDEVFAGEIKHALRLVLPKALIQSWTYVAPATHATVTSGSADKVPFGARLRLKASFDVSTLPTGGARVIAAAMKKYGMFLQMTGGAVLSLQSDRGTTHTWSESGVSSNSLATLTISDFEILDFGARTNFSGDPTCYRTP